MLGRMLIATLLAHLAAVGAPIPLIIDTDAGSDDLMAISFLLTRADVHVEAITIANGLAHVRAGGANVLRLLALAGRSDVAVYLGSETPLQKTADFPAEWRKIADELPGVKLPPPKRSLEQEPAATFLARRLSQSPGATVLALGPLTNIAMAFRAAPSAPKKVHRMVIMGGAFRVPGNLGDGGLFKTDNKAAEWNIFADPEAARVVFQSGVKIDLVPLDATSKVPIDWAWVEDFRRAVTTPLGRFIVQVLESDRVAIEGGFFQAWDPLAAVALVHRDVVMFRPLKVEVRDNGRTAEAGAGPSIQAGLDAHGGVFRDLFLAAFRQVLK